VRISRYLRKTDESHQDNRSRSEIKPNSNQEWQYNSWYRTKKHSDCQCYLLWSVCYITH